MYVNINIFFETLYNYEKRLFMYSTLLSNHKRQLSRRPYVLAVLSICCRTIIKQILNGGVRFLGN